MNKVYCDLLGVPSIKENMNEIYLPSGKVEGVFYYLLVNKSVARDEMANLFWPYSDEDKGKTSLRNAIHKIRKAFSSDIISTPNRSILMLNEDIEFIIDVDLLESNRLDNREYPGDFLKNIAIRDSVEFEYWVTKQRTYYKDLYMTYLKNKIKESLDKKEYDSVEMNLFNLISIDNYNEDAYYLLFDYYKRIGRHDKLINEYHSLKRTLMDELGIKPNEKIQEIYLSSIDIINDKHITNKYFNKNLFYRDYEEKILTKLMEQFIEGKNNQAAIIRGETGIGKSMLKRKVLSEYEEKLIILETSCYSVEKNFSFSTWLQIISNLNNILDDCDEGKPVLWDELIINLFPDLNDKASTSSRILEKNENFGMNAIFSSIYTALERISKNNKVIVVLEDIQWADINSLDLLDNLILHSSKNVMFLITFSEEFNDGNNAKIDKMVSSLKYVDKIVNLNLRKFNKNEVTEIIKNSLPKNKVSSEDIDNIYEKSKGNPLFLNEYIELYKNGNKERVITDKISDIIQLKFSSLCNVEVEILELLSLFYSGVPLERIFRLLNISAFKMIEHAKKLSDKGIIENYNVNGVPYARFVNSTYKNYIKNNLDDLTLQIMNNEIGQAYESILDYEHEDIKLYIKTQYHFNEAKNTIKALKYEIYILNYYLSYNHELFPYVDDFTLNRQVRNYIKNDSAYNTLEEVQDKIVEIKKSNLIKSELEDLEEIELIFLLCKGRFLIREGNYTYGIKVIDRLINLSQKFNSDSMLLAGYKQLIIYGIQINDKEVMLENIVLAMSVAKKINDYNQIGILNRLYGLYYFMNGELELSEKYLNKSINLLSESTKIESTSSVSLSASYNYIGEIRKSSGNLEGAMEYFKKSIEMCKDKDCSCLAIFYLNLGKTYFLKQNYNDMKINLFLAKEITEQFDSYWKSPVINSFIALSYFIDKDYKLALEQVSKANNQMVTINNPSDIGMVCFVETIMSKRLEKIEDLEAKEIKCYLNETVEWYYYHALKNLDSVRDRAEIEYLQRMMIQ